MLHLPPPVDAADAQIEKRRRSAYGAVAVASYFERFLIFEPAFLVGGVERFLIFDDGVFFAVDVEGEVVVFTVWVDVFLGVSRLYLTAPPRPQPATHTIPAASSSASNDPRIFIALPVDVFFAARRERATVVTVR